MFRKLITIFICFNTVLGSSLYPKILNNAKDNFLKFDGKAGSDDNEFDLSNSQKKEIIFKRTNCGKPTFEPNTLQRILGGVEAIPFSWPWEVSVQHKFGHNLYYFCVGTIISVTKVLSAAHCFFQRAATEINPINNLYVVAGIHTIYDSYSRAKSQSKKVIKVNVPSGFNASYNPLHPTPADIAILHIAAPGFTFDKKVQPACLPTARVPDGSNCFATGWGNLTSTTGNLYRKLLQVRIPTISNATCSSWYGPIIKSNMVCAGYPEGGKGTCYGDSGGPLLCNHYGLWVVDGIANWAIGCGLPRKPTVYTRVFNFLNWIKSIK